jgi:hypothetical protein
MTRVRLLPPQRQRGRPNDTAGLPDGERAAAQPLPPGVSETPGGLGRGNSRAEAHLHQPPARAPSGRRSPRCTDPPPSHVSLRAGANCGHFRIDSLQNCLDTSCVEVRSDRMTIMTHDMTMTNQLENFGRRILRDVVGKKMASYALALTLRTCGASPRPLRLVVLLR